MVGSAMPNTSAPRFERTDLDGATEVLTLVRITEGPLAGSNFVCTGLDEREYPYLVQVTTGPNTGDDFVGLYDLDGDQVDPGNLAEWEIATDAPTEVIKQIETGWSTGTREVTRILA